MLNIHSFLQGMKNRIKNGGSEECYKSCLLVVAYTMVAMILVFSSKGFTGKGGNNVIEAYAKTNQAAEVFVKTDEETAEEANIRTDQNEENAQIKTELNIYEIGAMSGMAETVEILIQQDQKEQEEQQQQKEQAAKTKKAAAAKKAAAKKAAAKKAAAKKAAEKKKKAGVITLSAAEKEVLQRIVEAEATGEDVKGRILVANVILNRVKSKQFPDTVKEVVFQRESGSVQFSPTKDGRYWSVSISKETKEAVDRVLNGEDYSQGALYFSARSRADKSSMRWFDSNLKWLFKYHGHEFYTNK